MMRFTSTEVCHCIWFAYVGLWKALNLQIEPPQDQELVHLHLCRCILGLRRRFVRSALQLWLVRTHMPLFRNSALHHT